MGIPAAAAAVTATDGTFPVDERDGRGTKAGIEASRQGERLTILLLSKLVRAERGGTNFL